MKIKLLDGLSPKFVGNSGIKQGDGLSPLLFNIFINDLNNIFGPSCDPVELGKDKINNLLYADDLLIISKSQKGLQNSLDNLQSYCKKWHLEVNMEKTKSMVITPSGKIPSNFKVTFNNKLVEHVKKYKYLGFVIHNNGNFTRGTLALKQKVLNAWFKCRSILYSQQINNVNLLLQLFDKLVKPVLLYGVEVWGPDYLHKLQVKDNLKTIDSCFCEMIHNKACKSILGVRPNCSNLAARTWQNSIVSIYCRSCFEVLA